MFRQVEKVVSDGEAESSDGGPENPEKWWRRHGSPNRAYKARWPKDPFKSHYKPDVFNEQMVMTDLEREEAIAKLEE
eukprot:1536767-Pyramimonas_sp.AAC.1